MSYLQCEETFIPSANLSCTPRCTGRLEMEEGWKGLAQ